MRIQLTHLSYNDCENTCKLSYYHHLIGIITHLPLFMVRSWKNGMHFMSFCILIFNLKLIFLKLISGTGILAHWGQETHICVGKLTIIASDNGLSPGRRQAIIWTNAMILLIGPLGTNFSEILGKIHSFSFKKMHLKMSSAKWRLFGIGLNGLTFPVILSSSYCHMTPAVIGQHCFK